MSISLGLFSYLNCFPLVSALKDSGAELDLVRAEPARLNSLVVSGKVTVGGISAAAYAVYQKHLYLIPHICIASRGPVRSVLLVSKLPAEQLSGRHVLLTHASATSQVLVRLVLTCLYGAYPQYTVSRVSLEQGLRMADAYLVIGDEALAAYHAPPPGTRIYDLGAEWRRLTGRPMVYAVWACRRISAALEPDQMAKVVADLKAAATVAQQKRAEVAQAAARFYPYKEDFLRQYFLHLNYELDQEAQAGLMTFYRLAWKYGLLPAAPPLLYFEPGGKTAWPTKTRNGIAEIT